MQILPLHSFSARLTAGIVGLVLVTMLSAGIPAYWLTRLELEQQTQARMLGAARATRSLLASEEERIGNLLTLLRERPTLRQLLAQDDAGALSDYLQAFASQSRLDFLLLCRLQPAPPDESPTLAPCPLSPSGGFAVYAAQPAMLTTLLIPVDTPNQMAVSGGVWLNDGFLRLLAARTAVEQSLLSPDGFLLFSSIAQAENATRQEMGIAPGSGGLLAVGIGERSFYTERLPLPVQPGQTLFFLEIALPVDDLLRTERRSLGILLLTTGLASLVGIFLGIWSVRRLIDPLEDLTQAAQAISRGELTAPIPVPSVPSEVYTLATALRESQSRVLAALDDLSKARDWLDNLVQSIVEGIVAFDPAGRVTFINERAAELASLPVEEAIGRDVEDLLTFSDESGVRLSVRRLPQGSRQRLRLLRNGSGAGQSLRQPGQRAPRRLTRNPALLTKPTAVLEVTAARLPAAEDKEIQTVLILRDLTQEEALQQLRSYFLANVSHEFRTPLSTLNASIELLMDETLTAEEMRKLFKPVQLSLLGLETLVNNLLDSSSIEAGRFAIHKRPVNLNDLIAKALQVVQPLLERRQQSLALTEPAEIPLLEADPARITQVLINLLSNASNYSPLGAGIELAVQCTPGWVRLSVLDRGPGIPPTERANLFQRFVRLETQDGERAGMGLGLYVVRTVVEGHEGALGVEDRSGGGVEFWFQLPTKAGENHS